MEIRPATAGPVGTNAATWSGGSPAWGGPGARVRMGAAVDATAQLLGVSADAMKAALDDGKSLFDVASSKGVSASKVRQAVSSAIAPSISSAAAAADASITAKVAERIASHHQPTAP